MQWLLLTFLLACIGALIGYKLKIAGGIIIGALLAVAVFNILTGLASFPTPAKVLAQIISGAFIGMEVRRDNLGQLKSMLKPAAFFVGGLMLVNILLGTLIHLLSPCDLTTALFAAVPGGLSEISLISDDMGANTSQVALFQLIRLLSVMIFFPGVIRATVGYLQKREVSQSGGGHSAQDVETAHTAPAKKSAPSHPLRKSAVTLAAASVFGVLGYYSGVPAGALLFSVLAVSLLSIFTKQAYLPIAVKRFAMVIAGAFVGAGFERVILGELGSLILPMLLLVGGYFVFCTLLGVAISRIFRMDLMTSLFACTPAGASDMALIASDLGGAGPQVALLQIFRLFAVISLFPSMIRLVLLLWGNAV